MALSTPLKRDLGLLAVFCTASGAMISSGLFVLPGIAHAAAGPAVVLSYLLAGMLATTGMLSQAELVSAMPKAGGTYFFVMRTMGPAVGTVNGLITWLSLSLKTAFALVGLAALGEKVSGCPSWMLAIVLCIIFTLANILGVKRAGRLQTLIVIALLGILGLYTFAGLPAVNVDHFKPFAPHGVTAVVSTAGLVFVSYGGLLKIAAVSEEVRNPGRNIPLGMALSLITVTLLYVGVVFVTSGALPASELDGSLTPITDGATRLFGKRGGILLGIGAALAFISTANAGIMASSRYPLALSRDKLLPEQIEAVNRRFGTPHIAILSTGLLILVAVMMPIHFLVKTASSVLILSFLFSCLCVIIMRESHLLNYRPRFRSPLYPWIQLIGTAGCILLLVKMGIMALQLALLLVCGGFFVYWFYGRIRSTREYALLHLVERLTRRDLTAHMLETELKEIIQERDHIEVDRFDSLAGSCSILDLDGPLKLKQCFERAARALAESCAESPEILTERMLTREQESSTAISDFIAIPHLEIDGNDLFEMVIIRCRDGISFSDTAPSVKAVFLLAGSKDQRNFHLKALAAIAQVAQGRDFEKRWMRARDAATLRDVMQLGTRRRQ